MALDPQPFRVEGLTSDLLVSASGVSVKPIPLLLLKRLNQSDLRLLLYAQVLRDCGAVMRDLLQKRNVLGDKALRGQDAHEGVDGAEGVGGVRLRMHGRNSRVNFVRLQKLFSCQP